MKRNNIGRLKIELRPSIFVLTDGVQEFHVEMTVGNKTFASLDYVLSDDEMRSRFDQLFDIAREALRREILGHEV